MNSFQRSVFLVAFIFAVHFFSLNCQQLFCKSSRDCPQGDENRICARNGNLEFVWLLTLLNLRCGINKAFKKN